VKYGASRQAATAKRRSVDSPAFCAVRAPPSTQALHPLIWLTRKCTRFPVASSNPAEATPDTDIARRTQLVQAFLAASGSGDFAPLLAVLDPDVVLHPDATAIRSGALAGIRGAAAVATQFADRAQGAQPALINGLPGAVWATTHGTPRGAFRFTTTHGKIVRIDIVMEPQQLRELDLVIVDS
jgi:hypothetical protein